MPAEPNGASRPSPGTSLPSSSIPDLVLLDAVELSWLIRNREVSCVEVMRTYLAHIHRFNPRVNAIVSMRPDTELLEQAAQRDRELDRGEWAGWMHGFPVAVKDLAEATGFPSTGGSPIFAEYSPPADELFVRRIRAAGGIVIGKTNVPEFGLGSHTFNPVFGTTYNPYDLDRTAGGSSGGAAAALAMRLLPVADGSDFMGSLRNPGAFCNVFGLRPSFGRVPTEGFVSEPSVIGPMGRSVRDTAMLLSTLAGPAEHAPLSIEQDPALFTESLEHSFAGARIGWVGDFDGYLPTETGVVSLCEGSFPIFEDIGCQVETIKTALPVQRAWETFLLWRHWILGSKFHPLYTDTESRSQLKPELIFEIEGYLSLQVADITTAIEGRNHWRALISGLFEHYDFLLAPSAQVFPFEATARWPTEIAGHPMDTYHRWMETVAPWTLSGHPVINLPVGFNNAGLPMGVQVIGRNHDELSLLRLAHAYERATDWVHRVLPPPLC